MSRQLSLLLPAAGALVFALSACGDDVADDVDSDVAIDSGSDAGTDAAGDSAADTAPDSVDAGADAEGSDEPRPLTGLALRAHELGVDEYLGTLPEPTVQRDDGTTATYEWGVDDGPLCLRGDEFRFSVRRGDPERLVVFLQGGGACWDTFCLAINRAPVGIPDVDALNMDLEANPLRDWSVAYLPYCDGSLFAGDIDHDDDGDGESDRFHRGLQNLSGALHTARQEFPEPDQILLTGSSAGGYGTLVATLLVRVVWPDAELMVFNDSGIGVARPDDPEFIQHILDQFNIGRFIPADCEDCVTSGHITPLVAWTLEQDPEIRIANFSSWYDSIIGDVFLDIEPAVFQAALDAQTSAIHDAYPDRYHRFIVDTRTHTALLGDATGIIGRDISSVELPPDSASLLGDLDIGSLEGTAIGDVNVSMWLRAFVENDDAWVDLVEEPTPWVEGSGS